MKRKKEIDAIAGRAKARNICPECGVTMYNCPVCKEYYCDSSMCPSVDPWHQVECMDPSKGEAKFKDEV